MADPDSNSVPVTASWNSYWHGTRDSAAFASGGIAHPVVRAFWDELFTAVSQHVESPRIVDLASGNGAVVERAHAAFDAHLPDFTCVDISAAAIADLSSRYPGVYGVVANANALPLKPASIDVVTSQFGIEYAGPEAIGEALRVLAPHGRLAALIHHRAGGIYLECATSLDALQRMERTALVPRAIRFFEAGFAACRGADRTAYDDAAKELDPAIRVLEAIMSEHGRHVAGDVVIRLYSDIERIHREIQQYDPTEVLAWLGTMERELKAYAGRMASMCACALDSEAFEALCASLREQEYLIHRAGPLVIPEHELPLAWVLVAECER